MTKKNLKKNKIAAVVLGADVNGLGQVRALGRMGIKTYVVCSGSGISNIARFSRYCIPICVKRDAPVYETVLKNELVRLAIQLKTKPILYATSDYFVNFMASNRAELGRYYLFNIPSNDTLGMVTSKFRTDMAARRAGLLTPETLRLADVNSAAEIERSIGFPCIIKPQDSFTIVFPWKNKIINDEKELAAFIDQYASIKNHTIVQEIIPGDEKNIFQCTVYIGRKIPLQMFTMQKFHQFPPGYGFNALGRSVTVTQLMVESEKLLNSINYTGFASVEFKKSDKDNRYYLIEINPRLPWYNSLFLSSGVNFQYLAYLDMKNSASIPLVVSKQRDNVWWVSLKHEISGLVKRKRANCRINILESFINILKARSFAFFDHSDLKPFLVANIEFFGMALKKIF